MPTSSNGSNGSAYNTSQSPSRFKRRHLFGQRIAPQSTTATTMQSPQSQSEHFQKGHFGVQHHSLRPSAWTIPVATREEEEDEEDRPSIISNNYDDDEDDSTDESVPFPHDSHPYDVPLITPDRSTPLKSNVQTTQPNTTAHSSRRRTTPKHQRVPYTRSLHNSHRKQTLHHITPLNSDRRPTNIMVATTSSQDATDYTDDDMSFMYSRAQQRNPHGHRGNGVVLDLTSLFSPTGDKQPPPVLQSPSETAMTNLHQYHHHTSPKHSNTNTYNAPMPPPWKHHHQHQQQRSPTTAVSMTPHSPSTLHSHDETSYSAATVQHLQWDTKSQTTQEALNTERQSQALTQWLNFVLVGEQQHQQHATPQEEERSTTRKKARRQRSFDGMSYKSSDDSFSRATTPTSKGRSGTPTSYSRAAGGRSVTPTPTTTGSRAGAAAAAHSTASERTTPTNNTTPHDIHTEDIMVVHNNGSKRRHHRRLSLFQYAQSFEHAHDQAHHWFHHSTQWKELRLRIRCEVGGQKMTLREDRDLYANIGCREQLLDMFLAYRPAWLTMALEVVMNDTILPPHQGNHQQHYNELDESNIPTPKQLKHFIVHRVLSDSKVLSKYTQGRGTGTPSGKFEQNYHDELRPLVLYRILVLIFFLDRAAVKFQALKSHNNNLGNLFHTKSKTNLKSTQQVLVMFCREFLSRQGDIIKQLTRVNLPVFYKQGPLDEIDYPIVNFAIDLRDGVRLCRLLELLWLLPRQQTYYANSVSNGKNGVDMAAKYPLLSQLRIPAISRLQKIHNVNVALAALQDDCHIGLPSDLQAHHIVDGQRRMVLRLVWTIVLTHCFDSHDKALTTEQLECEIGQVQAMRDHSNVMQKRQRRRITQYEQSPLSLLEQETNAVESVALMNVDDPMSPLQTTTPKLARLPPTLSLTLSRSSSFDGDQSFSSNMQLEDSPVVQQWKGLLYQWCQQVCMLVEDLETGDSLRNGATPTQKTFSGPWTAEDLSNGKALCCLIHHYHPTLLTLEDLRLSSTIIDGPPTRIQTVPTGRFGFTRQQLESPKIAPDYYMRLAQRRLVEIGGIPPMMLVPPAADSKSPRLKRPSMLPLEDEKSIVVFLYHVCARLMESRHQVNAVMFVQQRYRYLRSVSLFRQKRTAVKVIWDTWRDNKHTYYEARSKKYGKSVRIIEAFVVRHFDKLLLLQQIRVERELQNIAVTPIQAQVRRLLAIKHCQELRLQHVAAVIIQTRYRQYHDYLTYQLMRLEMILAVTTVQRHWRGFAQRWRYAYVVDSAIVLQAFVRGAVLIRKGRMTPWRHSAICIQRIWRGFCVQLQYQMDMLDIVLVQCLVRKHQAMRLAKKTRDAVSVLQRMSRGLLARLCYARMKLAKKRHDAVSVLQRMSRGLLARLFCAGMRRAINAAIFIQKTSRRYLAIQEAESLRTKRAIGRASLVVQRFWRRAVFLRERRIEATKIQAQWRAWVGHRKYCLLLSASVKAQSLWRRLVQRKAYLALLADAILIQSTFRRWLYGVVWSSERKKVVVVVQKYGRRFLAKRLLSRKKLHREQMIEMAILCQALARRNSCMRDWAETRRAVLTVQSKWRGFRRFQVLHRRQQLLDALETCDLLYRHAQKGSFKIVPHTRQVLQLSKQSKLRCGRKRIILSNKSTLVPPWRGHRQKMFWHRSHVKAMRWKFTSGARLRDLPRRKISIATLRQINEAASRFQEPWVYYAQSRSIARDRADRPQPKTATIIRDIESRRISRTQRSMLAAIQSLIERGFNAEVGIMRLSSEGAALRLDRTTTVLTCQPKLLRRRQDLNIERVLNLLRRNIRVSVAKHQNSTLQTVFDPFREQGLASAAAISIQKMWRGFYARQHLMLCLRSIVAIQAVARRFLASRLTLRCIVDRLKDDAQRTVTETAHAATLIQSRYRGCLVRTEMALLQASAGIIQSRLRAHRARVAYLSDIDRITRAQAAVRMWIALRRLLRVIEQKFQKLRETERESIALVENREAKESQVQNGATLQIQLVQPLEEDKFLSATALSGIDSHQRAQSVHNSQEEETWVAAVCIQRCVRGFMARQHLSLQHFAATEIQKAWRCYENTIGYIFVIVSAIKMQSFFRMAKAKKVRWELWREIWGIHDSAVKIQSLYRIFAATKFAWKVRRIRKAVVKIQGSWRKTLARNCALKAREHKTLVKERRIRAATLLQSVVRMHQAKIRKETLLSLKKQQHSEADNNPLPSDECKQVQQESKEPRLRPALLRKNAALAIQKAVRERKKRISSPVFHHRLSLSQSVVRGWIARRQCNPEVQKSIVLIKEAELRSKLHPSMRLGARMDRALKVLKSSSSLTEIMNIVCTIELATRFSKECCEEFVHADATETLVALLFSCNKSLPHVELLYYLMCTLLNVCKHEALVQHVTTVETAEAFLYLVRMYASEDTVFCSAVALLELCILHNENVQALVAAPACKRRMEGVYKQWERKLQRRMADEAPARGFFTPQFLVKRNANKAKTDMLILGISYDLERGVRMLEHILLRTL